ncbi:MAG: uL15 family ribosomal protein [Candidatus Aenigmarchaeota archaeon]|nr:uL15 family ribosomal protein [Candidatus Aenigmarchaeota archaeon]
MSSGGRTKKVKLRGSKTHGWGGKKKHRGKGNRGGKGHAGSLGHRKLYYLKYLPGHLGKHGFKSLRRKGLASKATAINIGDLLRLDQSAEIDAAKFGFDKVLGAGPVSRPVTVKAKLFSAAAAAKIEKAGGKAVTAE